MVQVLQTKLPLRGNVAGLHTPMNQTYVRTCSRKDNWNVVEGWDKCSFSRNYHQLPAQLPPHSDMYTS